MQLYSILILVELRRFMQAGVRWDFGTRQEISGFLGMFKIRLTSTGWAALDGIHGLPWKHNRNMVKNKRIKCIRVCGIQGTLICFLLGASHPLLKIFI